MIRLCLRPSTRKDDCLPEWDNSVGPFRPPGLEKKGEDDEPSSPRVGCMGQIKRNSKVVGFPIHHRCSNSSGDVGGENKKNYLKLNKVFSGKNLNSFLLVKNLNTSISTNTYSKRQMIKGASRMPVGTITSAVDLDPPLPVAIKPTLRVRTNPEGGDVVSDLWKRRCRGGETLKALQLQQRNPSCILGPNTL